MSTTYVKKESVVFTEVDGEAVLLDTRVGTYFGLDEMGSFVWNQIEERVKTEEIVEAVKEIYQVDVSQVEDVKSDIVRFLNNLEEKSLIYKESR